MLEAFDVSGLKRTFGAASETDVSPEMGYLNNSTFVTPNFDGAYSKIWLEYYIFSQGTQIRSLSCRYFHSSASGPFNPGSSSVPVMRDVHRPKK